MLMKLKNVPNYLSSIKKNLMMKFLEAVEACIDAASHEFDISQQRALLRSASYGQAFCSQFQRNRIQDRSRTFRVLNAVRHPDVGIPPSIQQYKLLTRSVLIGRLINAHQHLLALRISE